VDVAALTAFLALFLPALLPGAAPAAEEAANKLGAEGLNDRRTSGDLGWQVVLGSVGPGLSGGRPRAGSPPLRS